MQNSKKWDRLRHWWQWMSYGVTWCCVFELWWKRLNSSLFLLYVAYRAVFTEIQVFIIIIIIIIIIMRNYDFIVSVNGCTV